jgi:hypothetical protein
VSEPKKYMLEMIKLDGTEYYLGARLVPHEFGGWVDGEDCAALEAELKAVKSSRANSSIAYQLLEDELKTVHKIIEDRGYAFQEAIMKVLDERDSLRREVERLESALRLVAEPERQERFTPQQIAKHALRMEPLEP